MLCENGSCAAQLVINDRYVDALRHGSVLHISYQDHQNRKRTVDFGLRTFGAVYGGN